MRYGSLGSYNRLLEVARHKLVQFAKQHTITLPRTYAKEGKLLRFKAGCYAHAKQFKRMHRCVKRQRTIVGRLLRQLQRSVTAQPGSLTVQAQSHWQMLNQRIEQLLTQRNNSKHKIYALHAPEVECISKGKARVRYEFGVKVGIAITRNKNIIIGARSFSGNPYDGDTLYSQIARLMVS